MKNCFIGALLLLASRATFAAPQVQNLPPMPPNLPPWMSNRDTNHIFYKRGVYNFDIYNLPTLAHDLNAVSVGHSMAYEDLVTGRAARLESETFARINRVLKNPPKLMPDEKFISPTFGRQYGLLEQVFDWTHVLHNQTIDVMASTQLSQAEKEREIEALWNYYFTKVPYAITPLPMNMGWLDAQPYSGNFRKKYPKVNGLFWGYHWLQGAMYDGLWKADSSQQKAWWNVAKMRYHDTELYRTDRPFMPMFAETSPQFAARFPYISNAFDNLHMLHDMANDILASDLSEAQKQTQITRAIWIVMAAAHKGEKAGDNGTGMHDHRFFEGMEGMGLMTNMTPKAMWLQNVGWMNMSECHHCSMPLPNGGAGLAAWKSSTVSAEGWTMRVRCALCARDMSAEVKGRAVLHLATEKPDVIVTVISDEAGNLTTDTPFVIFIEETGSHARCNQWSQAFTNRAAFDEFVRANPQYKDAKPLTFKEWSTRESAGTPATYEKIKGPLNPYLTTEDTENTEKKP